MFYIFASSSFIAHIACPTGALVEYHHVHYCVCSLCFATLYNFCALLQVKLNF